MSATQRLKDQLNTTQLTNVLDFDLRKELKESLTATGKFSDVKIKMDGRRGHLNLTVRAGYAVREKANVIKLAATKNLRIELTTITSGYNNETTYRVTTLNYIKPVITKIAGVTTPKAAVATKPTPASKLTTAVKAETTPVAAPKVAVYLNYDRLGYVSQSLAKQIRQLVESENKPKFADVTVVDLKTSKQVTFQVPFDVAAAVKAQVPSFNQAGWVIKSTNGITILKQMGAGDQNVLNTWVIA